MAEVAAILLAAGRSSRYRAAGGAEATKLVAPLGGEPLVRRVARAALASRARPVVAVVGYAHEAVEAALAGLPLTIVANPDYATGLASSLRVGVAALPPGVAGALVLLGDMPEVGAPLIDALIAAFLAKEDALAAAPTLAGARGNPALLGRALFAAALRLEGDAGARRLLDAADPARLALVETTDAAVACDVDTPAALDAARAPRG